MRLTSVQEFLQVLQKSSLLSSEQMDEVWSWPEDDPKSFATRLVKEGRLTSWQAQQMLAGRSGKEHFFLGKYKLLDLIGVGGMGAVYKAVQPAIGRTVALKIMNRSILKQPKAVTRFLREIRSAAAVDHPNVVRAYDANCDGDKHFLVMEYVAGKDLKSWIRQEESLPIGWSCECIRQAALGLEHAFELGMVHRDIKPSNLLVTQNEHDGLPLVKILDLGLARFASETADEGDLTRSGQVLGTPDYIAPEQARNTKTADIRADIFSLGCTLFELLTGRLPFPGATVMEKLMARATEDAPRVQSLRADVPVGLDGVVAKMLARDPNSRYSTPAEVARALAPFAIGTPESTAPAAATNAVAANPFTTFGAHADATLDAFAVDIATVNAGEERVVMASRSTAPAKPPWLWIMAATAAAVVIFGLVWSLIPGRKALSTTSAGKQSESAKKYKKPLAGEQTEAEAPEHSSKDPERSAALWVLGQGGTLAVELAPRHVSHAQKGANGKADRQALESREVSSRDDLPAGEFQIIQVDLHDGHTLSGTDFERLAKLKHLERLSLEGTHIRDNDLKPVLDMPQLVVLNLAGTDIAGPGLQNLRKLKNLKELDLSGLPMRGRALRLIGGLESVQVLRLTRSKVIDDDLRLLSGMTSLKELVLASTQITGDGLKHLTWMAGLERLDLQETFVGDAGLKSLEELSSLKSLRLRRTIVSDIGARHLHGLRRLEFVDLSETKVTRQGVDALQHALPSCKIEY